MRKEDGFSVPKYHPDADLRKRAQSELEVRCGDCGRVLKERGVSVLQPGGGSHQVCDPCFDLYFGYG